MARSALHEFVPRVGDIEPEVKRAWLLNKGMVISFTRFSVPHERQPEDETRIAVVDPSRVQEAMDRANAEFGDPTKTLHIPDRLPEPA